MKLSKNLALSCEILAAHKLRTLLSVLGMAVGVGAVVLMVSVGRGAEKQILDRIRGMGINLVIVNAGRTAIVAGRKRQISNVITLEASDADAIVQECPAVVRAGRESENTNTNVVGMPPDGFRVRNITIASGRIFDAQEERGRRRVAVLGPTVVNNLFGNTDPIGLRLRIGRVPFEVIGITAAKGMDANGIDQDDLILVPLATAMRRLLNITHVETIYVQARDPNLLDAAEKQIRELLRTQHRLENKPDDFTIQNQATLLQTERETARSMTLLIGSVAAISLVVGGVGILAVMLISVRQRTPEIGLRRAVGATCGDIRLQFLVESALLAGAGGMVGVFGGVTAALAVSRLGYWETVVSWPAALVGFTFSVAVGLIFGIYPAVRAAALQPVEALRSD